MHKHIRVPKTYRYFPLNNVRRFIYTHKWDEHGNKIRISNRERERAVEKESEMKRKKRWKLTKNEEKRENRRKKTVLKVCCEI